MSVLPLLASQTGARGSQPNIDLAKQIANSEDKIAIKELVENLSNKKVQSDCIKVLYETSYIKPNLIADYASEFIKQLSGKNNRMIWGSMIALSKIACLNHKEVYKSLDIIKKTVDKGSVITIDAGVEIFAKLTAFKEYFDTTDPLLAEQLWKCPIKQLPQYAEKALLAIRSENREIYKDLIEKRMSECDRDSQTKRLGKVLKQIEKLK